MTLSRASSVRAPRACPGVVATAKWDDADHLRGEIHTIERLPQHAAELARAHRMPTFDFPLGALPQRFSEARDRITRAYEVLSGTLATRREPSPAQEWLLDNSHIVDEQIHEIGEDLPWGYLVQLPRLATGRMRGYPRVYGLCLDYLRHTDASIDFSTLSSYVLAYQRIHRLTIGELWAIPIMLRVGLVLTVSALAASQASARDLERGDVWARRVLERGRTPQKVATVLAQLEKSDPPVTPELLVELLRRLHEHEAPLSTAHEWVAGHCTKMGVTLEELTRRFHLQQAADQVSVGHAITSMRTASALDWNAFFERTSDVEQVLCRDPARAYADVDIATRDAYRHAVERLARGSARDEHGVALAALGLARRAQARRPKSAWLAHVGYWLIGGGRVRLERKIRYRPPFDERVARIVERHPSPLYFGSILLFTVAAWFVFAWTGRGIVPPLLAAVLGVLLVLPASEMAIALVNGVVVTLVPPRVLPKMNYENGIPADRRTLVVVPALLDRPETVKTLLESLEVRSLANVDANLHFALLTDFCDADCECLPTDDTLLALARDGIADLEARWGRKGAPRYMLLHRKRTRDGQRWMGWERKRGKLDELNRLLRGRSDTTYSVVTAPRELLASIRYVITLDADTDLPRDAARKLAATIAHPLNAPRLSAKRRRVVRGHGVIQPRIGTQPASARRTRFAKVVSAEAGLDPYTTAISDVYQDLFDAGSFVGKGIYDVDAFLFALDRRVPADCLLSHDLFEGIFARSALATDVEVLDEQPSSYDVAAARVHRWIRGDWQMLPWLLRLVPDGRDLSALDSWKIADNLRRSLLAPALVAACFIGWLAHPLSAVLATVALVVMFFVPIFTRAVVRATQARNAHAIAGIVGDDVVRSARLSFVRTVFLLDTAWLAIDAVFRTLYRVFVSRKHMLEWTTMSALERRARRVEPRLIIGAAAAVGTLGAIAFHMPAALPFAAPVLLLWAISPAVAAYLAKPERALVPRIAPTDRKQLRLIARRTWRFFETFVTAADHFLPPDNFQEDPRSILAHRTSPTNIGLYLLSIAAARDFGFISLRELVERYEKTLSTVEKLERHQGHLLNWYDTSSLRPLEPRYVSTVDSGNLAACLWTVREACEELARGDLIVSAHFDAADDALALASEVERRPEMEALRRDVIAARDRLTGGIASDYAILRDASEALLRARNAAWLRNGPAEMRHWIERAAGALEEIQTDVRLLAPHPSRIDARSAWSIAELDDDLVADCTPDERREIEQARSAAASLVRALRAIGERAGALADAMSFRFLFDGTRKLFSIGYNASNSQLDTSHYDLLASEARLASLVAIAKGDTPQDTWFRMGRPRARVGSQRVLLSWGGSMFEYLMPLLVTRSFEGSLLDETYRSSVQRQIDYGLERGVPWGISESAFNLMDLAMTYQYRAFGVPGLGLKAGLGEDLVVAPYATALAAQLRPELAAANFRALERMRALGLYGFYDAIDCTTRHLPPGRTGVVVRTFMAHHQGMTLVALDNTLNDAPMQRRFHADARIRSTELLLQERIPERAPLVELRAAALRRPVLNEPELDVVEHVGLGAHPITRLHLLGHGELSSAISALGEGFTTWKGLDVYRFREDQAIEAGGIYVYLRDRETNRVWSAGFQPTKATPDFYDVGFAIDRVEIVRRDGAIETKTEIVVSPERPAEVRRITLTNRGSTPVEIELTTYTEIVLAPRAADIAHRAFTTMFIETEAIPEHGALLAGRRPRGPSEDEIWVAQVLFAEDDTWQRKLEYETSRAKFLGRGRSTQLPAALYDSLSATAGGVLDPALALRRIVRLKPGEHACATLTTALATSRAQAVELVAVSATPHILPRAFELAWADARALLKHLGVSAAQSHRFQRLLSTLVFPQPALRAAIDRRMLRGRGRSALFAHGLTGELPLLVVRIDHPNFAGLFAELLRAHEFFRVNGVAFDLVALNEENPGCMQPHQQALLSLVRSSAAGARLEQRGGVFVRRTQEMSDEERTLVLASARVVLAASQGSLARQLRRMTLQSSALPRELVPTRTPVELATRPPPRPTLAFDNGYGGFASSGREYVAIVSRDSLPPMPWSNVIARPHFGTLVTESGASVTWSDNSQRHRLTPWSNDAVGDPSGESLFLRDDQDGTVWSPTPLPAGGDTTFTVRHGIGYTSFEHTRNDLVCELMTFVSPTECAKVWRLRLRNAGNRTRMLSIFGIVEWVLGPSREQTRTTIMTDWDPAVPALFAQNPLSTHPERHAFFTSTAAIASFSGDRDEIFGTAGSRSRPAALDRVALSGHVGSGLDPCAALHVSVKLAPGETTTISFVLGESETGSTARAIARHYRDPALIEQELSESNSAWHRLLGAVVVRTPDAAFDTLVNHWLLYQVTSCRLWGRSGFYQSSGAYGFRDQIQDVLALLHTRPDLAREHLLRAAGRQFVEGDVQHWWHPNTGEGVRTRCSDDMLWLPYGVAEYVRITGDESILDERITFLKERPLTERDEDIFSAPAITHDKATLYEHCTRALDFGTTSGPHGLPRIRGGDWNDGMSRVGRGGKGESVWLAWFLAKTLGDFSVLAQGRGDAARIERCNAEVARLARAVDEYGWDGSWYRRATFDNGKPLGSRENIECCIDAIAQSWAVIAGIGDRRRAAQAIRSSEEKLVRSSESIMRLLWPPFDVSEPDPGTIRAYPKGVRENGGQYTHGAVWTVQALAMLGEGDRAFRLFSMLNPIRHGDSREAIERYRVEPYVVAADVYDAPGHEGRGGWTWYTGAAGGMYRIAIEHILGIRRQRERLAVDPCVSKTWKRFEIDYRDGEGLAHIVIENPDGVERGVARVEVDGRPAADGFVVLTGAPGIREVRVIMGRVQTDKDAGDDETEGRAPQSA